MPSLIQGYEDVPNPKNPVGSVLYIGASYYNNWYLSRELRRMGWRADMLVCSAEGSDSFLHGYDVLLKENQHSRSISVLEDAYEVAKSLEVESGWKLTGYPHLNFAGQPAGSLMHALRLWFRRSDPRTLRDRLLILMSTLCPDPQPGAELLFKALEDYEIIHFTGTNSIRYLYFLNPAVVGSMPIGWDVQLLKKLGKKIVYTNIGCNDGVSQSAFSKWGSASVCGICRWKEEPTVCCDERNLRWGRLRNELTDYQIILGGNRVDYNDDPRVHEVPGFYCLDENVWLPDLPIPVEHRLKIPSTTVKIYHAVGNYDLRSHGADAKNIKSTHIYVPLVEQMKKEGHDVAMVFCKDVPSKDVRFYQAQSDILVDMLTFGFFGANVREGMMLGKPCVCFLRPEWLESMRREIPEYVAELPVISATPATVHDVLVDLIRHPDKRREIGRRSREFAVKWHSASRGAVEVARIYARLIDNKCVS